MPFVTLRNFSGHMSLKVAQHFLFEEGAVKGGDAVNRVAADASEMRHPDGPAAGFIDDRKPANTVVVTRISVLHLVDEAAVDLEDDLEMAWQGAFEQSDRPLLERLGKQRMVRVSHRLARHVPCRLPVHAIFIDEEAHELCDRKRGMRIVELNRIFLVEMRGIGRRLEGDAHHVLKRAGDEEILLLEPKPLALEA